MSQIDEEVSSTQNQGGVSPGRGVSPVVEFEEEALSDDGGDNLALLSNASDSGGSPYHEEVLSSEDDDDERGGHGRGVLDPRGQMRPMDPDTFRRFHEIMFELMELGPNDPPLPAPFPKINPAVWKQCRENRREDMTFFVESLTACVMLGSLHGQELEAQLKPLEKLIVIAQTWPTTPVDLSELQAQAQEIQLEAMSKMDVASKKKSSTKTSSPSRGEVEQRLQLRAGQPQWDPKWFPVLSTDRKRTFQNPGHPKLAPVRPPPAASPSTPHSPLSRSRILKPDGRLTIVLSGCAIHLELKNPLPLPESCTGYMCDMCNCTGFTAAWQVVTAGGTDGERDCSSFYKSGFGLDICQACASFYAEATDSVWTQFLLGSSDATTLSAGTGGSQAALGSLFNGAVQDAITTQKLPPMAPSLPTTAPPSSGGKVLKYVPPKTNTYSVLDTYFNSNDSGIRLISYPKFVPSGSTTGVVGTLNFTVALAPRGAHACAWVVNNSAPSGTFNSSTFLPADEWRNRCTVRAHGVPSSTNTTPCQDSPKSGGGVQGGIGECSICLEALQVHNGDCVQTVCHHWFHVHCIRRLGREDAAKAYLDGSTNLDVPGGGEQPRGGGGGGRGILRKKSDAGGDAVVCPLCRKKDALQAVTRNELLETNLYDISLQLDLRQLQPQQQQSPGNNPLESPASSIASGPSVSPKSSGKGSAKSSTGGLKTKGSAASMTPGAKASTASNSGSYSFVVAVAPLLTQDGRFSRATDFGGLLKLEVPLETVDIPREPATGAATARGAKSDSKTPTTGNRRSSAASAGKKENVKATPAPPAKKKLVGPKGK